MSKKPSEKEEEYFVRMEFERKKKVEEGKHQKLREEEKKKLRDLHFMRCPKCGMELIEIDYQGIKVVCTYHPAYLLRNPQARAQVWEDIKLLMAQMGLKVPGKR